VARWVVFSWIRVKRGEGIEWCGGGGDFCWRRGRRKIR